MDQENKTESKPKLKFDASHCAENRCPICYQSLMFKNKLFYCESCQKTFKEVVFCLICHEQVRVTTGCGATTYFCPNDKLLSRKQCCFTYQEIESK